MGQKHSSVTSKKRSAAISSGGGSKNSKSIGCRAAAARIPANAPAKQTPLRGVSALSPYIIGKTSSFLSNTEVAALSQTCRLFHEHSQPVLSHRRTLLCAQRLLEHVVRGEQNEAEKLLEKNPKLLLFRTGSTVDYSGRRIKGITSWQAALCAGDAEMLAMMKTYFDSIAATKRDENNAPIIITGREIREENTAKIFPKGFKVHFAQQEASTFNFDAIVGAIDGAGGAQLDLAINLEGAILPATDASPEMTNAGAANELTKALNAFRQAFTSHSLKETVYNPQHLLRAFEIYDARFNGWSHTQCRLFWSQVIGFAQRFMPACYAQAFAQGLYYLTKKSNAEALKRSLSFRMGDDKFFSNMSGFEALGFKFAARWPAAGWNKVVAGWPSLQDFKKYVKQKQTTLRTYVQTHAADPVNTLVGLGR